MEIGLLWLFQHLKNGAYEYLYIKGMNWDPLGREGEVKDNESDDIFEF